MENLDDKKYFKLVGSEPREVENFFLWKENPDHEKVICADEVNDIRIITKFVGLADKNDPAPKLFSTRVIGEDREVLYYHTFDQATRGHMQVCKEITLRPNTIEATVPSLSPLGGDAGPGQAEGAENTGGIS